VIERVSPPGRTAVASAASRADVGVRAA
jgi:hypothetical protein